MVIPVARSRASMKIRTGLTEKVPARALGAIAAAAAAARQRARAQEEA
jgi:hypothetical protein